MFFITCLLLLLMNLTFVDVFEDPAVVGEEVLVVLEELGRDSWMECVKVRFLKKERKLECFPPRQQCWAWVRDPSGTR